MVDPADTDRLISFLRDEARNASDERQSWFDAAADHLQRQADRIHELELQGKQGRLRFDVNPSGPVTRILS